MTTRKLCLGTAQFGLDYGINNPSGKIKNEQILTILRSAHQHGIDTLDTAPTYGDSEQIIGSYTHRSRLKFNIISKLSGSKITSVARSLDQSLDRLRLTSIYGYLVHDFDLWLKRPQIWDELQALKQQQKIKNIGFSVYYPHQVDTLLNRGLRPDILQVPYSLLDQRFAQIFPLLQHQGIKLYARSVFLQGLIFFNPSLLPAKLVKAKPALIKLLSISESSHLSPAAMALNFVLLNPHFDKVIIGLDNIDQLQDNLKSIEFQTQVKKIYHQLLPLGIDDEQIVIPMNWQSA